MVMAGERAWDPQHSKVREEGRSDFVKEGGRPWRRFGGDQIIHGGLGGATSPQGNIQGRSAAAHVLPYSCSRLTSCSKVHHSGQYAELYVCQVSVDFFLTDVQLIHLYSRVQIMHVDDEMSLFCLLLCTAIFMWLSLHASYFETR